MRTGGATKMMKRINARYAEIQVRIDAIVERDVSIALRGGNPVIDTEILLLTQELNILSLAEQRLRARQIARKSEN